MAKHSPRFLDIVDAARREVRECGIEDVKRKLAAGETFCLIDVREESEWAKAHAKEAQYLGK
ncbi:MAG: sulfurtransferase, partial [Planctomycetaceae bacterium]|nr:sulfurtransferase [Planctomycetaceae bacterium]